MESLIEFVQQHGYWMLFAVGFAEFSGFPIVSVPVLVAVGGLSAQSGLSPVAAAGAAAAGGLLADAAWFALGRWQGHRLVGAACNLASNPRECVLGVESRVGRYGPKFILPSKFLPGVGNLLAPAAGFSGMGMGAFLAWDAMALLLWAGGYTAVGWIFAGEVQRALEVLFVYRRWVLTGAGVLIVAAGLWRWARSRLHEPMHRSELARRETVPAEEGDPPGGDGDDGSGEGGPGSGEGEPDGISGSGAGRPAAASGP